MNYFKKLFKKYLKNYRDKVSVLEFNIHRNIMIAWIMLIIFYFLGFGSLGYLFMYNLGSTFVAFGLFSS